MAVTPAITAERPLGSRASTRLRRRSRRLALADPVLISPPSPRSSNWVARSDSQNRTLRSDAGVRSQDVRTGQGREFADRPLIDRVVSIGVAAHEGQFFGWFNQLLGLLTAIGYLTLVVTSIPDVVAAPAAGALGAPPVLAQAPRLAPFVIGLVVVLGVLLPTLGMSLIVVLVAEFAVRRIRSWRRPLARPSADEVARDRASRGGEPRMMKKGASAHDDLGPDADALVEIDHVLVHHADAA